MSNKASLHREDLLPKHDGELSFLQHLFFLLSSRKCCKCLWLQTPEICTNAEATTRKTTCYFSITPFPLTGKDGNPEETVQVTHGAGTQSRAQTPCPFHTSTFPSFLEHASKRSPPPSSALCSDTRAIVHSCGRLEAEIAAHYPGTSPHTRTPTRHRPLLTPTHTWASPALLQPQVPPGGDSSGLALPGDIWMSPPELFMPAELIPRCCQGRTKP